MANADLISRKTYSVPRINLGPQQRMILATLADAEHGLTYEGIRQATSLEFQEAYPVVASLRRLDLVSGEMEARDGAELPSKYLYCTPAGRDALAQWKTHDG